MPDLDFTDYSRERMKRRHISEEAVYHIVGDYDHRWDRDDGRTEYAGIWEGVPIVVVTEGDEEEGPLTVINAMPEHGWR